MKADERGSAALVTLVLLPLLLASTLGVLQLGLLRVVAAKAETAADLAAVAAIDDQDDAALASGGRYRPTSDAEGVARAYLLENLTPFAGALADAPEAIAARADIAVLPVAGMLDTRTGRRYSRPVVRVAAQVPVSTPLFAALCLPAVTTLDVVAASSAR